MRWLLPIVLVVAACGGDDSAGDTTPNGDLTATVLGPDHAPAGTSHVATVSWDDVRSTFEDVQPEVVTQVDAIGFRDATLSVFVGGAAPDELVDLTGAGRLRVSGALTFDDDAAATAALDMIDELAGHYAAGYDAALQPLDASGIAQGALGAVVDDPSFPGGAAAIIWVEGDEVMLAFAQGGDAGRDVLGVAGSMTEGGG